MCAFLVESLRTMAVSLEYPFDDDVLIIGESVGIGGTVSLTFSFVLPTSLLVRLLLPRSTIKSPSFSSSGSARLLRLISTLALLRFPASPMTALLVLTALMGVRGRG